MLLQLPPLLHYLKRFSGQLSVCFFGFDPVGLVPQRLALLPFLDCLGLLNDGLLVKVPSNTLGDLVGVLAELDNLLDGGYRSFGPGKR